MHPAHREEPSHPGTAPNAEAALLRGEGHEARGHASEPANPNVLLTLSPKA